MSFFSPWSFPQLIPQVTIIVRSSAWPVTAREKGDLGKMRLESFRSQIKFHWVSIDAERQLMAVRMSVDILRNIDLHFTEWVVKHIKLIIPSPWEWNCLPVPTSFIHSFFLRTKEPIKRLYSHDYTLHFRKVPFGRTKTTTAHEMSTHKKKINTGNPLSDTGQLKATSKEAQTETEKK